MVTWSPVSSLTKALIIRVFVLTREKMRKHPPMRHGHTIVMHARMSTQPVSQATGAESSMWDLAVLTTRISGRPYVIDFHML